MANDVREISSLRSGLTSAYPQTAQSCIANIERWSSGRVPLVDLAPLEEFLAKAPIELIHDSFWRQLPFGTGGVRGTVGFGPNRINEPVIALTAQAHSDFLAAEYGDLTRQRVVVANDIRFFDDVRRRYGFMSENPLLSISSRSLAWLVAKVYTANGLTVYMGDPDDDDAFITTPELSFFIRHIAAVGGVNLSASHNPPDDNGIKVYDAEGGQYLPPHDQKLADMAAEIAEVRIGDTIREGAVKAIESTMIDAYQHLYLEQFEAHGVRSTSNTSVLFTPLNGCGERTVVPILTKLGYDVTVPEGHGPDGSFSLIPLHAPNPEVPVSTQPARDAADAAGLDVVFSADPDADRLGIQYRDANGDWQHVNGNQIATAVVYFLVLDPEGPQLKGGVFQTLVTTLAVLEIAQQAGVAHIEGDLYVGFKYIAGALLELERKSTPVDELISFACEESHGYLTTAELREKDAVSAVAYLAHIHERCQNRGQNFGHYLEQIRNHVGAFGDCGRSLVLEGSAGMEAISACMTDLRTSSPEKLGRAKVTSVVDHWQPEEGERRPIDEVSATERSARNIVVFEIEGGRVTVRPSGTEPKLKFYVQTAPSHWTPDDAISLAHEIYAQILGILNTSLSAAAIDLPDVLPVAAKVAFDHQVGAALHGLQDSDAVAVLDRVRGAVGDLVPGEDALRTVEGTVRAMAGTVDRVHPARLTEFNALLDAKGGDDNQ